MKGKLAFLDTLIKATSLVYADQNNQIFNMHVSFNNEMIFQRYEKISLSNECAEVIAKDLEKVKILLF